MPPRTTTLVLVLLAATRVVAGTHWVSADGSASWTDAESVTPLSGADCCSLRSACESAVAGDTVVLRGGTYEGASIVPRNSGRSDEGRLVFTAHAGEEVVVRNSRIGFRLDRRSYVTITRIRFQRIHRFFEILGGRGNEVGHCVFEGRHPDASAWAGAVVTNDSRGGPSTHNLVHHCRFEGWWWRDTLPHRGALLDVGVRNLDPDRDNSTHNRIEDNVLGHAGHHLLGVYSRFNVVRRNRFHNETTPDYPGHRAVITEGTSGGHSLFEGNRVVHCGTAGIGLRSPANILRFNVFHRNAHGGVQVVTNQPGRDRADDNRIHDNTFVGNGHGSEYPGFQGGLFFANWRDASPRGNVVRNNLFRDNANGSVTNDGRTVPQLVDDNWNASDGDPRFVDPTDGGPDDSERPDLRLGPNSPARDRGAWLTTVTSDEGRGRSFRVEDAGYFTDGWGVVEGDRVQLEGDDVVATIVNVDHASNTITVDRDLAFEPGLGIALPYAGSAPEPGAFELPERRSR